MAFLKGRNVKVEVALTYAAGDTITGLTLANPGQVTATAHGQANGAVGYINTGLAEEYDGQAYYVSNTATNTFDLTNYNTTGMTTFTSGTAVAVATWGTLSQSTSYTMGGGDATQQNVTTLIDKITQNEQGMLAAQTFSFDSFVLAGSNAAMDAVEAAALSNSYVVFRITHNDTGDVRVFRGQVSLPGENVSVDQVATAGFSATVKGRVIKV